MKTLFVSGFVILLAISAWATLNNDSDMTQSQNMGNEGINVHGDWEVKIIDPDGSSEVFAFKNALTDGAPYVLSALLAGQTSVKKPPSPLPFFQSHLEYGYTSGMGPEDLSAHCKNTEEQMHWNGQEMITFHTLIPTYSLFETLFYGNYNSLKVSTTCEFIGETNDNVIAVYSYVELNKGIPNNPWNFRGELGCSNDTKCTMQHLTHKKINIGVSPGDIIETSAIFSFD